VRGAPIYGLSGAPLPTRPHPPHIRHILGREVVAAQPGSLSGLLLGVASRWRAAAQRAKPTPASGTPTPLKGGTPAVGLRPEGPRISGLGEDVEDLLDDQNRLAADEDAQLKVPTSDPGGGHVGTSDVGGTRI
jgi:hypothetical protein